MAGISKWMEKLDTYPGWREWNRGKIRITLELGEPDFGPPHPDIGDFVFSKEVDAQHTVAYGYMALRQTVQSLASIEFYFRRYPFRDLPVSKHEHLTNICEMYFSRFYEFREKSKNLLNAVNKTNPLQKIEVGRFIRSFDKTFDAEIRERHGVHHRDRFDDIQINKVWLTELMARSDTKSRGWEQEHRSAYRTVSREWASRAKLRAVALEQITEGIAAAIIIRCPFLSPELAASAQQGSV